MPFVRAQAKVFSLAAVLALAVSNGHAGWERIGVAPHATRAIVMSDVSGGVGFAADRAGQSLFSFGDPSAKNVALPSKPLFYAYAHDWAGTTLCTAYRSAPTIWLACYDGVLTLQRKDRLPVPMTSGALLGVDTLWLVDPSGTVASRRMPLVTLRRTSDGWIETGRRASPLCEQSDSDADCSELEIHPLSATSIAIIPLMGRFDGKLFRYPALAVWNLQSSTVKRVRIKPLPVPAPLQPQYRSLQNVPVRLVYRSAASRAGKIALIAVLPSDKLTGVKRNELWVYDGEVTWTKTVAPGQLNAIAFAGETPVVVTEDGIVFRWTP